MAEENRFYHTDIMPDGRTFLDHIQEELVMANTKNDVSNTFVCVYDNNRVGLFKGRNGIWKRRTDSDSLVPLEINAGVMYEGIDSDYIGIKFMQFNQRECSFWGVTDDEIMVDGTSYVANCCMSYTMSFDAMRLIMAYYGQIGTYESGKATSQEMAEVLNWARSYYELAKNDKVTK